MANEQDFEKVADFLQRQKATIIQQWADQVCASSDVPKAGGMARPLLEDHTRELIDHLVVRLRHLGKQDPSLESEEVHETENRALHRFKSGYNLAEAIREISLLRLTLIKLLAESGLVLSYGPSTVIHESFDNIIALGSVSLVEHANKIQDRFIGILGHDLKNPLTLISMSADALMRAGDVSDTDFRLISQKFLARILRNAHRMNLLIADVLDFARARQSGAMKLNLSWFDLNEFVRLFVDEFRATETRHAISLTSEGNGSGYWDRERISQVLSNLLSNAIRFSPPDAPVSMVVLKTDAGVNISIHNQGKPISPEQIKQIFNPFRRGDIATEDVGRGSGLGLGLYIVHSLVDSFGGEVRVASNETDGTTFTLVLPVIEEQSDRMG